MCSVCTNDRRQPGQRKRECLQGARMAARKFKFKSCQLLSNFNELEASDAINEQNMRCSFANDFPLVQFQMQTTCFTGSSSHQAAPRHTLPGLFTRPADLVPAASRSQIASTLRAQHVCCVRPSRAEFCRGLNVSRTLSG